MKKLEKIMAAALITTALFISCGNPAATGNPEGNLTPEELAEQQKLKDYENFYNKVNNSNWKAESPDKTLCEYIKISEWTDPDNKNNIWIITDYYLQNGTKIEPERHVNNILPKTRPESIVKKSDSNWIYDNIEFKFISQNELKIIIFNVESSNILYTLDFYK